MRAVRIWITVELLFGLFGASAVLLDPAGTATNFAWPIASPAAASVLGACYGSVAVMLAAALFARDWGQVRPVVAAAGVLTSVMLLATFLHWPVFTHDSVAFGLWFASYLLPPPTLLALWIWQERRPAGPVADPLPGWAANLFMGNAVILASVWTFLFFVPMVLAPLPPVLVRVYAGWALGLAMLLWLTGKGRSWRLPGIWLLTLPAVLWVQLSRYPYTMNAGLLIQLLDLAGLAAVCATLLVRRHGTTRRLAVAGALGVGLFLAALVVLPVLRPDLDVRARWVGEYAHGPYGGLMVAAYLVLGAGALCLGLALRTLSRTGGTLLALASGGAFLSAVFGQDDTATGERTVPGTIREIALVPTFALLITALALLTRSGPRFLIVVFAGVPVSFAAALAASPAWKGIAGRGFDAAWTLWMAAAAAWLLFAQVPPPTVDWAVGEGERGSERRLG
jgi:hypothetical protein